MLAQRTDQRDEDPRTRCADRVPERGSVLAQSLLLAATQLSIAVIGDSVFVLAAARMRQWFARRPGSRRWSRRALAGVFAALAARLAFDDRR